MFNGGEKEMANIKWSYMDHWKTNTPQGLITPFLSKKYMDRYIKQIAALGFQGLDTFGFRLNSYEALFGSMKNFREFLQERGIERVVGAFMAYPDISNSRNPHVRSTHGNIIRDCEATCKKASELGVENLVVMPASTYWQSEPITDEKLKIFVELWDKVGKMSLDYGIHTTCHHEFWCGVQSMDQIEKFYAWTNPDHVFYFCDTAQHTIAGVDPVELYLKYHDRTTGFHFKDTHNVDTKGEYRIPPDPEVIAPSVARWFWEMGTPEGLVDFPRLMKAIKEYNYKGWITVEHDKADVEGGNYAESTCISKWYIDNVLTKIYK
jgi:inosose dehydratase